MLLPELPRLHIQFSVLLPLAVLSPITPFVSSSPKTNTTASPTLFYCCCFYHCSHWDNNHYPLCYWALLPSSENNVN